MSLDQAALFEVVVRAYRSGVLDKLVVLLGNAIEEALEEGNLTTWELLNMADEADDASFANANGLLGMVSGLIPLANNDKLMMFLSYLLDDPNLTAGVAQQLKAAILDAPASQPPTSVRSA